MAVVGSAEVLIKPSFAGLQKGIKGQMGTLVPIAGKTGGSMGKAMGKGVTKSGAAASIGTVGASAAVASRKVGGFRGGLSKVGGVAAGTAKRVGGFGRKLGAMTAASAVGGRSVGTLGRNMSIGGGAAAFMAKKVAPLAALLTSGAFLVSGFKMAAGMQKAQDTLTGLYGSATEAKDMMSKLRDVASNRPIDYSAFTEAAGQLAYMGLKGKGARKVLANVADAITAAGGSSEDMGAASNAMLKMVNSGKVYSAQLNQISQTGVPIFSALAAHFDTNIKHVREMVQSGKVGIDDVMDSIKNAEGKTFKQMKAAAKETAKSFSSQFSIAKDKVKIALGDMFTPFVEKMAPKIKGVGNGIVSVIKGIPKAMKSKQVKAFADGLKSTFGGVLAAVKPVGAAIAAAGHALGRLAGKADPRVWGVLGAAIAGATAAFAAWKLILLAVRGATLVAAAAQWLFDAAMKASPIGMVITLLGALAAGVVYAYKHFKVFRDVVNAVWSGIKTATKAVVGWFTTTVPNMFSTVINFVKTHWPLILSILTGPIGAAVIFVVRHMDQIKTIFRTVVGFVKRVFAATFTWLLKSVIRPVFDGIKRAVTVWGTVFKAVFNAVKSVIHAFGAVAKWLWHKIIEPVFNGIKKAAQIWWTVVSAVFELAVAMIKSVLGPVFTWLKNKIIKPVFGFIKKFVKAWWAGVKIIFTAVKKFVKDTLGAVFIWLKNKIIKPVFNWIKKFIKSWWAGVKIIFNAVRKFLKNTLGPVFTWLKNKIIKPVWDGIKTLISKAWGKIKSIFGSVKKGTSKLGDAFKKMKDVIGKAWQKIKDAAKKPIKFVIEKVLGTKTGVGLIGNFNKLAKKFHTKTIPYPSLPKGFDRGGWTGPGAKLRAAGTVHADEFVVKKSSRRRFESRNPGALDHLNRTGSLPGYYDGGLVRLAKRVQKNGGLVTQFKEFGQAVGRHMKDSLHYSGRAFDLNTRAGTSAREQNELAKFVGMIHAAGMRIKNEGSHYHVDDLKAPDTGQPFPGKSGKAAKGGGLFDIGSLLSPFKALFGRIKSGIGGSTLGRMVAGGAKKMINMPIDWLKEKAKALFADIGEAGSWVGSKVSKGVAYGKGQAWAARNGWFGAKRQAMNYIIGHESSWDPRAQNPHSSAHGLPQMINSTAHAYGMGSGVWSQLDAFKRYVNARYGGVVNAANHWKSHGNYSEGGRVAKYDNGGMLPQGLSTVLNATGKPEPVFTSQQFKNMSSSGAAVVNVTINGSNTDTPADIAKAFNVEIRRLSRSGAL